jgi:hypothetical protein
MLWQAVVRFLWDAHNCEEAREEEELVVSTPYIEHWNDLIDLWYLGMQVRTFKNNCSVAVGSICFWASRDPDPSIIKQK